MAVSSWRSKNCLLARDAKEACPLLLQMMDSSGKRLTRDSEENWANLDFYHHSAISSAEIYCLQCGYVRDCQVMSKNWGPEEETPFAGAPPILGRSVARSVTRSRLGQPKTAGPRCRSVGAASRLCVWKLGTPKMDQNGYLNSGKLLEHRLWGILFSGKAIFGILRRISCADEKSALLTLPSLSQWGDDSQRWWNMVESSVKPWSRHDPSHVIKASRNGG